MKLAQLKWIGRGPRGHRPLGRRGDRSRRGSGAGSGRDEEPSAVSAAGPQTRSRMPQRDRDRTAAPTSASSKSTEERLRGLEDQIDRIYRLSGICDTTHR